MRFPGVVTHRSLADTGSCRHLARRPTLWCSSFIPAPVGPCVRGGAYVVAQRVLLDASILFNYDNPFNAAHLLALAHTTPKPIWALSATMTG